MSNISRKIRDRKRPRFLTIILSCILVVVFATAVYSFFSKAPGWEDDRTLVMQEIESHPDEGILYYYLARMDIRARRYNGAIDSLENALKKRLSPGEKTLVYHELGNCYYEKNKTNTAIIYYRKALAVTDDHAPSLDSLGRAYFRRQDFEKARQYFEKAVAAEPDSAVFNRNLAGAYLMLDNTGKACEYWERALKINPAQPQVREFLEKYR